MNIIVAAMIADQDDVLIEAALDEEGLRAKLIAFHNEAIEGTVLSPDVTLAEARSAIAGALDWGVNIHSVVLG